MQLPPATRALGALVAVTALLTGCTSGGIGSIHVASDDSGFVQTDSGTQASGFALVPGHVEAYLNSKQSCFLDYGGEVTYEPHADGVKTFKGQRTPMVYVRYVVPKQIKVGPDMLDTYQYDGMCPSGVPVYVPGSKPQTVMTDYQRRYIATGQHLQSQWNAVAKLTITGAPAKPFQAKPVTAKRTVTAMNLTLIQGVGFWAKCTIASPGTLQGIGKVGGQPLYRYTTSDRSSSSGCPSGSLVQTANHQATDLSFAYPGTPG
jgi:hypothetical protein